MSEFLKELSLPLEVKKLTPKQLNELAVEIREFLIENVLNTGGHLASNLGVVELTLALHTVFDMPHDKIVWDVGHQSYVHKLLTGRMDKFDTMRKYGGISGFPKTAESEYDFFNTGHSSTSLSAALGIARARDLDEENYDVIAVFGDGSMTGGMLFEALNDAGRTKTKLTLVLNDNAMSIAKNVGAMSKYLRNLRQKPGYYKSMRVAKDFIGRLPVGSKFLTSALHRAKVMIKKQVLPTTVFDDLGYDYIGPVDGHNIVALIHAFEKAKLSKRSCFIHVHTKKGKGYSPAESNPELFHGVSPAKAKTVTEIDCSSFFGEALSRLAVSNEKIVAITGAMPLGTGLDKFAAKHKKRYFDVGIAEQHAVTMAAGLAISGYIPVVPLYSSFLQRAYDQVLHDVCLQKLHVVFPIDRAGIVGADGETHQGIYDISFLSHMPYMSILSPSTLREFDEMLEYAINKHDAPIAIRYPRGILPIGEDDDPHFEYGKANVLKDGNTAVIYTTGRMVKTAIDAAGLLESEGISVRISVFPTISPLNTDAVIKAAEGMRVALTLEDGVITGGFGSLVSGVFSEKLPCIPLIRAAFPDEPIIQGKVSELDAHYLLDPESIANKIKERL